MEDISYVFLGKADYKTVVENDTRVQKQKRMVLCNLKEAHRKYLEENINTPENKVGFSKFCSLRPEECIFAEPKGTHSVCVCFVHQNFELMFDSSIPSKIYRNRSQNMKKFCMIQFANHQLRIAILMYVNSAMIFLILKKRWKKFLKGTKF
jgi:hypothetical protein